MVRWFGWIGVMILIPRWGVSQQAEADELTLMFYNVENLFDIRDDSLTRDEAFLPEGDRHWTYNRLQDKLIHIYKVIAGIGAWQPPAVVALAEVENRYVLEALLQETPLHRFHYQIVHQESPDSRGIDVALLYRPELFSVLHEEYIPVKLPSQRSTRDILYVSGQLPNQDTVHLYVNHWPSRYSGTKVSEPSRLAASTVLENHIHQLLNDKPKAKILVTGDFNDSPEDSSLMALTRRVPLENISQYEFEGTHKHQGHWSRLDQWLASESWEDAGLSWSIKDGKGKIYHPNWLLEEDQANLGFRPRRTYVGFRYNGGFSDHLPIYIGLVAQ